MHLFSTIQLEIHEASFIARLLQINSLQQPDPATYKRHFPSLLSPVLLLLSQIFTKKGDLYVQTARKLVGRARIERATLCLKGRSITFHYPSFPYPHSLFEFMPCCQGDISCRVPSVPVIRSVIHSGQHIMQAAKGGILLCALTGAVLRPVFSPLPSHPSVKTNQNCPRTSCDPGRVRPGWVLSQG